MCLIFVIYSYFADFTMGREINEILKQIGCSEGMTVPVANERNQRLQKEVSYNLWISGYSWSCTKNTVIC